MPKKSAPTEIPLRIVLVAPPSGVDFGLQEGKGSDYKTIQRQRSKGLDLGFDFTVTVKDNRDDGVPNFLGPFVQGPTTGRFIYIGVGKLAGQIDSCWDRRIKVPLTGINWQMIESLSGDSTQILEVQIPGTGKDGGPSCATVKSVRGWKCCKKTGDP
jgi:hypothetical protein